MTASTLRAEHGNRTCDDTGESQQNVDANDGQKDWISGRYFDSSYVGYRIGHHAAIRFLYGPRFPGFGALASTISARSVIDQGVSPASHAEKILEDTETDIVAAITIYKI
jgi:hypothetical protein